MPTDAEALLQQDTQTHKTRAWVYWALSGTLTSAVLVAYPPVRALGPTAGWSLFGVLTALQGAYVIRLYLGRGTHSDSEAAIASIVAVVGLALSQWLCGGYHSPVAILYATHVFGAAAVLTGRVRALHLLLVLAAVMAPAVYGGASAAQLVTAVVWMLVLLMQAGYLYDYGLRLRAHRLALLEAERQASQRALTDALTGLANRRALEADLDTAGEGVNAIAPLTIVYVDLDGFKAHNDELGHAAGDELLQRLAHALHVAVGSRGRAYRVGGDEFCVLLDGVHGWGGGMLEAIAEALSYRDSRLAVTASLGAVVVPHEVTDVRLAVRVADQRMYEAKRGLGMAA